MSSPTSINSEVDADYLYKALTGAASAGLPDVDLYDETHSVPWDSDSTVFKPVEKLTISDVVSDFEAIMTSMGAQLQKEFDQQRITGAKFADTYMALTQAALQSAVQFELGKDQAYWMSVKTQADAITANNQNEIARLQAELAKANFALTKLKLATEDSTFGASEYNRLTMLPAQKKMTDEQMESQRAQTSNTRSDGTTAVTGLLGVQKDLYTQQISSYQADTKIKATKIFQDFWLTQKAITEELAATDSFNSATKPNDFNAIFSTIRTMTGAPTATGS